MKYTLDHYNEFQQHYAGESDRSAAILAASYLEHCLEEYLLLRLVADPSVDALFEGFGPLATFSAKIDVAFAVGLLPSHIQQDLKRIKKIRNLFAHDLDSLTFESPQVKQLCGHFFIPRSDGTKRRAAAPREQYLTGAFWCFVHIWTERERMQRLSAPKFRFEEVVAGAERSAEPSAPPNGDPAELHENSRADGGPPSVS